MDTKERENFNRNSTLIVEHTKNGFTNLIDLNVTSSGYGSFENFINAKQHEIYHLCYNRSRCCQCTPGYTLPRARARVIHPCQLDLLLDKNGPKKMCHNPGGTGVSCCSFAHRGLTTNVLDVTLARCLLVNFCQDVFWYSCLTAQKQTLEDFLTHNKHHIYHLYDINSRCCQCPSSYVFPTQRQIITKTQWNRLFNTPCLPCLLDRKRPVGGPQTICASSVTPGITVGHLGADMSQLLIDHCCTLKKSIEKLVQLRNNVFGHIKEARITNNNYAKYRYLIESNLLLIAGICHKKTEVQQQLHDLDRRTLDGSLLMQTIKEQLYTVELLSAQMSEESSSMKEEITTRIAQATTEIKEEITTKMAQVSGKIKEITRMIAQHIDERIKDMSTTLKSQVSPDMVKQQIEEKRKKLLENTENLIKTHTNENTFVHTNAVNKALACVKQNGIVILIGPPGIGKSRIGLELLRLISVDNERRRSIQLDDISQWRDMSDDMDAVFIDDVFGRTNCSYNDNVHSKLLEMIYTTNQNKNIKVILTLRNNIYRSIASTAEHHRIFHDKYVLDLSKNQMTVEEKKSCLMKYLTKNMILETADIKKENINDDSILDTASTVYLHKDTLQKILHSDIGTHIGFPEACYLFATHRKFTKQGHNFFSHPTDKLLNEIKNLRKEGDTKIRRMIDFTLLVYILLNGDSVNVREINLDAFLKLMKTIYLNPLDNILRSYINDSAEGLSGKYLKLNNEHNYCFYCFQHRLISEAVMISYSVDESEHARAVVPLLGFDFITEMARPQCYRPGEGEVIFPVPVSCYRLLAQRLLQLLDTDYKRKPYLFVQNLCKSKIITMTGNNILQEMITQYKYTSYYHYMEYIDDHRFSGGYSVNTSYFSYFYLSSALMMFCNIDNNSIYQSLYDSIHNTLTSKSDSDVMMACKDTLVIAFNFAVCTLDVKRSTVILKILTDHNIKQDHTSWLFCYNIVGSQGLPAVQLMFSLHDLSHVFNITSLLSLIFSLFYSNKINIDDNMKQFITSVIVNNNHDRLLVRAIVEFVCKQGQLDFVKDVCERFDSSLFDVDDMIIKACIAINTEVIQWLMEKYHGFYNVQEVLDNACSNGYITGVRIILDKSDHTLLDMKSAMNNACSSGDTELVKWLYEKFDNNLFDMKTAMNNACRRGDNKLVRWLCEKFDNNLFDMKKAMNNACSRWYNTELVKWLCEKFDNNLFDMKTAMNNACSEGDTELVKWLCEKFDSNLFDMKTAMYNALSSGKTELVKWLCEKFDDKLFDMKTAMNNACSRRDNTELVKWLCEKFDNNLFDMKTAMNNACSSEYNTELVKWLCEKFDNNLFDMKSAMNIACSGDNTELVKLLCETFDNNLFDMKTAMNNACSRGKTELVKWLCEKFDNNLFDMKSAMNIACSGDNTELVKLLCETFDNNLFDMKTAMNNACSRGKTELVKWLCEKFVNNLFDLKTAMNNACSSSYNTELVKWFCEKFDNNLFDMKTAMNNAFSSGNTELVKWFSEKFDNNLFDMKSAMNNACSRGNTELVKWLFEKFDNNVFDMKTAIMNTYNNYNSGELESLVYYKVRGLSFDIEVIDWLFDNFDPDLFDVDSAEYTTSRYYHIDQIQFIFHTYDFIKTQRCRL